MQKKEYCTLLYSCDFKIPENPLLKEKRKKEIGFRGKGYDFYSEKYYDFESLVDRIKNIFNQTISNYNKLGIDAHKGNCSFNELIVRNKIGEPMPVGVSTYGWNVSLYLFHHLNKYFEEHYGKGNVQKMLKQKTEDKEILFSANYDNRWEPDIVIARELVSEETALIILKNFLEGKDESDLDPEIFYREIDKRNYLD